MGGKGLDSEVESFDATEKPEFTTPEVCKEGPPN